MGRDRESETHIHAARIALNRCVEKFLNSRKIDNLIKLLSDLGTFHTQDRSIQEDVLTPSKLRMKSGTNLEQTSHSAVQFDLSLGRVCNQREDLEQRRFTAP